MSDNIMYQQPVNITEIQDPQIFLCPHQQSNNFHHRISDTFGGTTLNYTQPKASISGYKPQFNIPTGDFAIVPHASYFQYDGKFTFKFPSAGKFMLNSGYWWFQQAVFNSTTKTYSYATTTRICISEGPLNSFCVLRKAVPSYSTPLNDEDFIYLQRTLSQSKYSSEYQNAHSTTWFNSGTDQWVVEWLPNKIEGTPLKKTYMSELEYAVAKTAAPVAAPNAAKDIEIDDPQVKVINAVSAVALGENGALTASAAQFNYAFIQTKREFIIPFNLLNMQFDTEHNIYYNVLSGQDVKLVVSFLEAKFAYCFDHSNGLVLVNGTDSNGYARTGLIDHKLHLMTKSDTDYKSDTAEKGVIGAKLKLYDCYNIATRTPVTGRVEEQISRSIISINDLVFFFQPTLEEEWNQFRQVSTFFKPDVIVDMLNNKIDKCLETLFPFKFNIRRQGGNDKVFTEDLSCLETFRYEYLRCMNYNQNITYGLTNDYSNLMSWITKFGFIAINLQNWNNDLKVDIMYDGVDNSGSAKLSIAWEIANYSEFKQDPQKYNPALQTNKTLIDNYDCYCFLNYDALCNINVKTSRMSIDQE
ncbi:Conserved_hypothetical protein [Hexamita inflata]|uniref:Major capsid protein n=1 Tax=Hexamita inflata TaxID=28002 RepID=A0AA86R0R2_9EUKA|nr:Conserved hypothetical protein [Hexamita inflata]